MGTGASFSDRLKKMREESGYGLFECRRILIKQDRLAQIASFRERLAKRVLNLATAGDILELLDILEQGERP